MRKNSWSKSVLPEAAAAWWYFRKPHTCPKSANLSMFTGLTPIVSEAATESGRAWLETPVPTEQQSHTYTKKLQAHFHKKRIVAKLAYPRELYKKAAQI
ncbi:MAG TPA: hypothetical protein VNI52_01070 [Sphingobacteriaceae bacterium]|nr:hypothetical protein [Sphingobacteriaceae bacterium]